VRRAGLRPQAPAPVTGTRAFVVGGEPFHPLVNERS
jgi:hypothetical protein